jgi:hypothetical protein
MADLLHRNNAGITSNADELRFFKEQNTAEYKRICNVLIPTVWNALVDVLLDEEEDREQAYVDVKEYV